MHFFRSNKNLTSSGKLLTGTSSNSSNSSKSYFWDTLYRVFDMLDFQSIPAKNCCTNTDANKQQLARARRRRRCQMANNRMWPGRDTHLKKKRKKRLLVVDACIGFVRRYAAHSSRGNFSLELSTSRIHEQLIDRDRDIDVDPEPMGRMLLARIDDETRVGTQEYLNRRGSRQKWAFFHSSNFLFYLNSFFFIFLGNTSSQQIKL